MALLGCIADDLTGATDVALAFANGGLRVEQHLGLPETDPAADADALVVALKSRSAPVEQAVADSLAAARWLAARGVESWYFKIGSTFDSTDDGNIGPVAEALLAALGGHTALVCPAFPALGRQVIDGELLVDGVPLAESPMHHHPLNPMRESSLPRLLGRQMRDGEPAAIGRATIAQGADAVRSEVERLRRRGHSLIVADAEIDDHLATLAEVTLDEPLTVGAAGLAAALPAALRRRSRRPRAAAEVALPHLPGPVVVLAGSCSEATRGQLEAAAGMGPRLALDAVALCRDESTLEGLRRRLTALLEASPPVVLVSSSATPEQLATVRQQAGDGAGAIVEFALADLARTAFGAGVRKLIAAGGETSGAVAEVLGVDWLRVGPEIAPGVPWMVRGGAEAMLLAFKSGNFGGRDFFRRALDLLPAPEGVEA